jgi:hypothetical protein
MFGGRALFSVRPFILIDLKGFRWKPICGDRVENSDSLNRSPCCARAASSHAAAADEQCHELAPSQLIELHSVPLAMESRQHSGLARIRSGLAAMRNFGTANGRSVMPRCPAQCPVCPIAEIWRAKHVTRVIRYTPSRTTRLPLVLLSLSPIIFW